MIKVEVLENFRFARYKEIEKSLISKTRKEQGKLFKGDIFECNKEMADYLLGDNPIHRAVVKVIEIIPEETQGLLQIIESEKETKKTIPKKKTTAKKSIAKK